MIINLNRENCARAVHTIPCAILLGTCRLLLGDFFVWVGVGRMGWGSGSSVSLPDVLYESQQVAVGVLY